MKFPPAIAFAILAASVPAAASAEGSPLTLGQVIADVVSRYPTIASAQAAVDAARARTGQSGSERLPQVSADAEYTHLTLRPYIPFGGGAFYTTIYDSYDASVTVRQLLTDFGRTDTLVSLARSGEISARDALEQEQHQLGYQAIQSFYGVILLRQSVAVADEEITALQEALRIARKKFSNGTATKFDVLTTQVRLANSQNRRTDTAAMLEKQENALRELLGWSPQAPLALVGDLSATAPQAPDLSYAIAEGLRERPEIKLARDRSQTSRLQLEASDRASRPTLSAQVSGGVENGQLPAFYDNRGYGVASVGVSVPLFTSGKIPGERVEARADLRAADAKVAEATREITDDVENAATDLTAAVARLANSDTLVAQAAEALTLAQARYSNGVITNFELLDAQSAARGAELARLQARYDCVLASQAVARAEGRPPQP